MLHLLNCRANAPRGRYSVNAASAHVGWHELHHSPFDLADEYCCDGGYFQRVTLPNMYRSLNDCQSFGSDPATCRIISRIVAGVLTHSVVPWFVSDPSPDDVMNENGRQNADDARKVRAHYLNCTAGGC